jgi:tripartite-type tricarboxylate transporter receptor subunit TctC
MRFGALCLAGLMLAACSSAMAAESAAGFYKNKTITLVIGADPGGTYDPPGRLLARHLPKHIPGTPRMVVEDMPGAGSALAANYLMGAPQDGTVLVGLLGTIALAQALGEVKLQADLTKLQWIGNMAEQAEVVLVWHTAPANTIEDAKRVALIMGAPSPGTNTGMMPRILNHVLGTKFKVITGYGFASLDVAMERGEIHGQAGASWMPRGKYADMVKAGTLRVLLQSGFRDPSLGDVPLLQDLVDKNSEGGQLIELFSSPGVIGKPTIAGPGVPKERVALLRKAYEETMIDPAFLADAERIGVPIHPVSGEELQSVVKRIAEMPPARIAAAKAALAD